MRLPLHAVVVACALSAIGCGTTAPAPSASSVSAPASADGAPRYSPWPGMPAESIATDDYGRFTKTPNAPSLGDNAPAFQTTLSDGSAFDLAQAIKPTVIVFYRGFW